MAPIGYGERDAAGPSRSRYWHGPEPIGRAAAVILPRMNSLAPDTWRRLLCRVPDDAEVSSLYGPLLQSPSARDGCFVLGRIAQSLDGRIATVSGASHWISGHQDIVHTHRLRALFDAVVIGARTMRADDPQLTTREVEGPSPVRVVLDTDRRLDARYRVFRDDQRPCCCVLRTPAVRIASVTHRSSRCRVRAKGWISSPCSRRLPNADCGACSSRAAG